jgi:hypothetical protein
MFEPSQYIHGNLKVATDAFKNKKSTLLFYYKHFKLLCNYAIDVSGVADDCQYDLYDSLVWWNNFSGTVQ